MEASPQQPNFVEVCSIEDIWEGEMQCFSVRDASILLLKLDGRFRAYQGRCPHQGVALVEGDLDGAILTCRAHHWQFNALNGEGINPRKAHLECFATEIVAGKIFTGVANHHIGFFGRHQRVERIALAQRRKQNRFEARVAQGPRSVRVAVKSENDSESFAIAQRASERQAALHMTIAIRKAAVATDESKPAR